MKRFKQVTKCMAAVLSFCLVLVLGIAAQAAQYVPGELYVGEIDRGGIQTNSKGQYYSVLKGRMYTYVESTIHLVYPKDAALSVKTSNKALGAEVTYQTFGSVSTRRARIYVSANPNPDDIDYSSRYYVDKYGASHDVYQDSETKSYYCYIGGVKFPVTPNRTRRSYYPFEYTRADGTTGKTTIYDAGDGKGWYYTDSSSDKYEYYDTNTQSTVDGQPDYAYCEADVQLSSTKAGTYTVTITAGSVTKKVKVYVTANCGGLKSAKLGKTVVKSASRSGNDKKLTTSHGHNEYVKASLKSDKFKVTADKGVKVTGMIVAYTDKNGKLQYKKVKNGGKIPFSQDYDYKNSSSSGSSSRSSKKYTHVYVSKKDSYTGTSTTYSIVTKHGYKELKVAVKRSDGKTYISYDRQPSATYTLWTY